MKAAAVVALADACTRFALGRKDVMPAKANTGNPLLQMLDLYPDDLLALVARSEELIELAGGLV